MVVTIEDRAVKFVPMELETTLQLNPCCVTCKATNKPLRTCSNCKLVSYCSKECQASDWGRHKKEDECNAVKKARRLVDEAEDAIRQNAFDLAGEALGTYGADAFLGRDVQDDDGSKEYLENSIFNLLAGRFYDLSFTYDYMQQLLGLYNIMLSASRRHETRTLWEQTLETVVEANRLTHASIPDLVDMQIPLILLKLHRNDDAISYILYWMRRYSRSADPPNDPDIIRSKKGEWPFQCLEDARLLDVFYFIHNFRVSGNVPFQVGFAVVALAVKLRHICVFRNLTTRAEAFRHSTTGQKLPADVANKIVAFLTGGTEASRVFARQWDHTNQLLNYIDGEYPFILPSVLDLNLLPPLQEDDEGEVTEDDQSYNVRYLFELYEGSPPVLEMLTDILKLRYGYSDSEYWDNFKRNLSAPTSRKTSV